jgi:hypothetical protein
MNKEYKKRIDRGIQYIEVNLKWHRFISHSEVIDSKSHDDDHAYEGF